MKYIPLIVTLLLILVIVASVYAVYRKITRKIRSFTRQVYGTSNLQDTMAKMKSEYSSTPKSVSAITSLCLPKIMRDFPDFSYDEMKTRANNVLTSYLSSISAGNASLLSEGNSDLKQKLANHIADLKNNGQKEHFDRAKIHQTEISQYRKADGKCIITFQSSIEYLHYLLDKNGALQSGDKDFKFQSRYNVDLIYIQNRELVEQTTESGLGIKCPNCDAPITSLGAKVCEYCGSPIIEFNIKAWSFSNVTEI